MTALLWAVLILLVLNLLITLAAYGASEKVFKETKKISDAVAVMAVQSLTGLLGQLKMPTRPFTKDAQAFFAAGQQYVPEPRSDIRSTD